MELENELFLATIEWTWECCLKQKESDNEKSVALCKAYKGGQFGLLQVDQTDEQGKIEYRKVLPQHISYLFPRAFGQWRMLQYMRLAKYLKLDRRAYCKVVW